MKKGMKHLTKTEKKVVEQFARLIRSALDKNLKEIEIFGSKVRGDFTKGSDVDILIIVKNRTSDVMDRVAEITAEMNIEYNLPLSPVIFSEYEYKVNTDMSSPFILSIEKEGIGL